MIDTSGRNETHIQFLAGPQCLGFPKEWLSKYYSKECREKENKMQLDEISGPILVEVILSCKEPIWY
jgi:hypothetical protein